MSKLTAKVVKMFLSNCGLSFVKIPHYWYCGDGIMPLPLHPEIKKKDTK
jgi:hypothetical protein